MKGRIDILEELIKACPESAGALTYQNESVLHLAVQSNSFETFEFLVKKLELDDDFNELLNLQDYKGNTILHHAVTKRQLHNVKLLLSKGERVEVNARNHNGLTALDVLLDSPRDNGDLTLAEMIHAAGGKIRHEIDPHQPFLQTKTSKNELSASPPPPPRRSWIPNPFRCLRRTRLQEKKTKKQAKAEDNFTTGQLMVVAALIATITFQAGLNPPGGFTQGNCDNTTVLTNITNSSNSTTSAGIAVHDSRLGFFLLLDMIGLCASLSIILILICVMPKEKKMMMKILIVIMWVAVFSTALAFSAGTALLFPQANNGKSYMLVAGWFAILAIFMSWVFLKFVVYLLRKVGWWWRKKELGDHEEINNIVKNRGCLLWLMRIGAVMLILLLLFLLAISFLVCVSYLTVNFLRLPY